MSDIREPIKKTSIEKKERIIKMGFELMCDNGYHNVSSVDIAKYAGVSTGIIYQYFNDKRDIFIAGCKDYANRIMFPMLDILDSERITKDNLSSILEKIIDSFILNHTMKTKSHEELMAMTYLDNEVAEIFNQNEILLTKQIKDVLAKNGFNEKHLLEKVHLIIGIIDNYCHEVVYHQHKDLDYNVMKDEVINTIVDILK